jgi:hypothetical protein
VARARSTRGPPRGERPPRGDRATRHLRGCTLRGAPPRRTTYRRRPPAPGPACRGERSRRRDRDRDAASAPTRPSRRPHARRARCPRACRRPSRRCRPSRGERRPRFGRRRGRGIRDGRPWSSRLSSEVARSRAGRRAHASRLPNVEAVGRAFSVAALARVKDERGIRRRRELAPTPALAKRAPFCHNVGRELRRDPRLPVARGRPLERR